MEGPLNICSKNDLIFPRLCPQAVLSSEKLPPLEGILVGGKTLQYSLIQKIKSRERERQRIQRQRSRESTRRSLSLDAPSFYMSPLEGSSSSSSGGAPVGGSGGGATAGGGEPSTEGGSSNDQMPPHRRQLGERLYPKVHALQPVSGNCGLMVLMFPFQHPFYWYSGNCIGGFLLNPPNIQQCSKLRVHPAPCVHDFNAGCTISKAMHPACPPFQVLSVYLSLCAFDLNSGRTHILPSAPRGCTHLNRNFEHCTTITKD